MLTNPDFEQNKDSLTLTGICKNVHGCIRLMKWICYYDRKYYENINYYDLVASICNFLKIIFRQMFSSISYYINRDAKMSSRKCEICNVDVHRASYMKHRRSKKHIENMKQNEVIISEWLFQEPVENKIRKLYNPKSLKQIARNDIKLDDTHLNKELARRTIIPNYSTDRNLTVGFKKILDSHHINHANFKLTIIPNYSEF